MRTLVNAFSVLWVQLLRTLVYSCIREVSLSSSSSLLTICCHYDDLDAVNPIFFFFSGLFSQFICYNHLFAITAPITLITRRYCKCSFTNKTKSLTLLPSLVKRAKYLTSHTWRKKQSEGAHKAGSALTNLRAKRGPCINISAVFP